MSRPPRVSGHAPRLLLAANPDIPFTGATQGTASGGGSSGSGTWRKVKAGGRRARARPTAPSGSSAAARGTSCATTTSTASGRRAGSGGATWPAAASGRSAAAPKPSGPCVRASGPEFGLHGSTAWCGCPGRAPQKTGTSLCPRTRTGDRPKQSRGPLGASA